MVDTLQSNLAPIQVLAKVESFCSNYRFCSNTRCILQGEHVFDRVNGAASPDGGVEQRREQAHHGGHTQRGGDGQRGQPG